MLDEALLYLDRDTTCHVLADWSPFQSGVPRCIATFCWTGTRLRVKTDDAEVRRMVDGLVTRMLPVTRLGLHLGNAASHDGCSVLRSDESVFASLLPLFPYHLLNYLEGHGGASV